MTLIIYSLHAILAFTVNFSLAILILLDAPNRKENKLYFTLTILYALWSAGEALVIGSESSAQAYIGMILINISISYVPVFLLIISYKIPFGELSAKIRWYVIALLFLIPTAIILFPTKFFDTEYLLKIVSEPEKKFWIPIEITSPYIFLRILQTSVYIFLSIFFLIKKMPSLKSMREKYGDLYLLTCVIIFFALYVLINTNFSGNSLFLVSDSLLLMGMGLMNAHFTIGDKLFNFRRFFQGGLRFSVISAVIATVYIFAIKTMAELFSSMYVSNRLLIEFLIIFAFILFLNPTIIKFQNTLRRFLTRDYFRYRSKFVKFDKQISNIFSPSELMEKIRNFIDSVFRPQNFTVLFIDKENKYFISHDKRYYIPANSPIAEELLEVQQPIEIIKENKSLFSDAFSIYKEFSGGVLVPYIIDNELRGIMILGSRQDNKIYNPDELEFLYVIYRPIGILMERNYLLKTIRDNEEKNRQMEKLASLGRMTAGIAHEFRNPLNVISIAAETIIRRKDDKETMEKMLKYILEEIDRLNKLVSDFLKLSKPVKPVYETADFEPFIDRLLEKIKSVNNKNNISVTKEITAGLKITADFNLLEQAVTNIINNAFEAMKEKGELNIKAFNENGKCIIEISDTGGGIPNEYLNKVFDPFFTTKDYGTGLGLSITNSCIESMNGELNVRNSDKGAIFTIILPENKNEY